MMDLFRTGNFTFNSGINGTWKIDCDWKTISDLICGKYPYFSGVTGIPSGGDELEKLLLGRVTPQHHYHLIVDDVYTTGLSMRKMREDLFLKSDTVKLYRGIVVFARNPIRREDAYWIEPMFQFWTEQR
jgi:hypothetical protein